MTKAKKWNSITVLSLIFVVALTARLLSLILDPILQRDAALYLFLAEKWQETGDYTQTLTYGTIVPPLPLFSIIKLMDWGVDSEVAGRSIALFLGALIPVVGYCMAYILFNNMLIAAISAFLFCFHPVLVSYSIQPLRENYYLFFLGLTILEAICGIKNKKLKDWFLCGFFLAFAIFSRYESLEFFVLCTFVLFGLVATKKIKLKKALSFLCVLCLANIATCIILLSITNYDISFLTKISEYKKRMSVQNNVRDYF